MEKGESRNRRDEAADAYEPEQEATNISETAEKVIAAAVRIGLKIDEAKEKLVVSKENKKLKTDRKSENFHRDKRSQRLQADRLSVEDDNIEAEAETADASDNAADDEADGNGHKEVRDTNEPEVKADSNDKNKKTMRRKMRERMREQRQREYPAERYDSNNGYSHYYNEGTDTVDGYNDYGDNEEYGASEGLATRPSELNPSSENEPVEEENSDMDSGGKTDKTEISPSPASYRSKDDKPKLLNGDTASKPGKLSTKNKAQGLIPDKTEVKLRTENRAAPEITLTEPKQAQNKRRLKLRRKQRNSLAEQKYNLQDARLAHASAVSKLIINSGEENANADYAEQEQDNLNKNLVNTASTGLKSVITDFESFEADLFSKENSKDLQKDFTRKKQRKHRYIEKKAETAAESKSQAEISKRNRQNDTVHKPAIIKGEPADDSLDDGAVNYPLNSTGGGVTDYSLNSRSNADSLNLRTSGGNENLHTRDPSKPFRDGSDSGESPKADNGFNLNHERQKKKAAENAYKKRGKNNSVGAEAEKDMVIAPKSDGNINETQPPSDTATSGKSKKPSRLKHDKDPHSRNANPTAATGEKLKFNKENASWHGSKNEKLRIGSGKNRAGDSTAVPLTKKKEANQRITALKAHNKKTIRKKAKMSRQKLAENTLRYGKKTGKNAVKQTLETVKFITRLILQKIVALVLFLIGQIFTIGAIIMIPIIIIAIIGVIFFGTTGTMLLTSYLADDKTLTDVTVYYSDKEADLIESLTENRIKTEYGVDEVNFILVDNIGHNPHYLLSYLTAKYQEFTFGQVQSELDAIFDLQYTKTITVRTVEVPILDEDGEPTGGTVTRTIADVTLTNNGFYDILYSRLSSDEREHFLLLLEMSGNRQYGGFPMSWDWLINITEDFNNLNNGVEAEVPENTAVYGTVDGEIVNTSSDSVSIQGAVGEDVIIIKFSRLNSVVVGVGDTVEMTTVVGYTSDRIFIQIQRNGVYVNPVLFLGSRRQDLIYGTTIPPLTQSEVNDLTDFADDALGTPYVFGTSNPPDRTDCSGFIWWAYDGSGIKSWGRTTAQGQFNQCDPIMLADARPGDLIFFQGTYDTKDSRVVTHVGIYLGNGEMQHSGSPNQITSINTAYWQEHFYSFGRLRR